MLAGVFDSNGSTVICDVVVSKSVIRYTHVGTLQTRTLNTEGETVTVSLEVRYVMVIWQIGLSRFTRAMERLFEKVV